MPKYTLTEEEKERLTALSPAERAEKFATIEKEINESDERLKLARESERDLTGELKAQRRFLSTL